MPEPVAAKVLTVDRLTKRFGKGVLAVNDLSFSALPGRITGFLGPNGSGKSTTLRCILGLVSPSDGETSIGGVRYSDLSNPARVVGASLESTAFHPARSGTNHLRMIAAANGIDRARVTECLAQVGLTDSGNRNVGGYSLGMRQRLGLAAALLGDPHTLILDEPANGLDPEGIAWLRSFLRHFADQGRTVLISSHLLTEVSHTVDDVVIINHGSLVRACPINELTTAPGIRVRSPGLPALLRALPNARVVEQDGHVAVLTGVDATTIGDAALAAGIPIHELAASGTDLERIFLDLTSGGAG